MSRVKRGVTSHRRHKKVLKAVKGQWGRRKNTIVINNSSTLALQLSTLFEEMWNSNPNSWINKIINKIKFY